MRLLLLIDLEPFDNPLENSCSAFIQVNGCFVINFIGRKTSA